MARPVSTSAAGTRVSDALAVITTAMVAARPSLPMKLSPHAYRLISATATVVAATSTAWPLEEQVRATASAGERPSIRSCRKRVVRKRA